MAYSKNILPTEAAYYKLQNASISNGILSLQAGGIAYIDLDETFLTSLPSSLLLNFYTSVDINPLEPEVSIFLDTTLADGTIQNFVVYPVSARDKTGSIILDCTDGAFDYFRFCIKAKKACSFLLWELCPQQESDITTIIEGVEQSLPHVLYDYNTWQLQVEQEEMSVGMIACYLLGNTDVNGHFSLDFYASEYCNLYIRFRDNEVTELYTPMLFTVNPGHNTIGIPHAYLKRLAGIHNFVVTCQCTNGVITIYPRGLLYSIDAGYLAERLIDAGLDIMDVAIKQTAANDKTEELWCIGLDAGELLVKSRAYNTQANTAWTPQYSMGKGLSAAIEFDGDWVLRDDNITYTIETEEQPYIFVIEEDKTLVVYKGDDFSTRVILDTSVDQVSVVRGYKSNAYPDQDQGLIAAYIKGGKIYYRQLVYFQSTGKIQWDTAKLLDENTNNTFAYVQRLNDYRVGFVTSNSQNNMWYITDRTYVNQAVLPELVYADTSFDYPILSIVEASSSLNFDGTEIQPEDATDTFLIDFDYPLYFRIKASDLSVDVTVNGNTTFDEDNTEYFKAISFLDKQLKIVLNTVVTSQKYEDSTVIITVNRHEIAAWTNNAHLHEITKEVYTFTVPFVPNTITSIVPAENTTAGINLSNSLLQCLPINKIINKAEVETASVVVAFEARANMLLVNKITNAPPLEIVTVTLQNDFTFSAILVGAQPI